MAEPRCAKCDKPTIGDRYCEVCKAEVRERNAEKTRRYRQRHPDYKKRHRAAIRPLLFNDEHSKECSACHRVLPRDHFYKNENGWRANCDECAAGRQRTRYQSDPEYRKTSLDRTKQWMKAHPERARALRRKSATTWSPELFDAALLAQKGICPICLKPMSASGKGKASADHCHKNRMPRDITCGWCNPGLGLFCDDADVLERAAHYIRRHAFEAEIASECPDKDEVCGRCDGIVPIAHDGMVYSHCPRCRRPIFDGDGRVIR